MNAGNFLTSGTSQDVG